MQITAKTALLPCGKIACNCVIAKREIQNNVLVESEIYNNAISEYKFKTAYQPSAKFITTQ